jgi:pyruvate,water dikinase
MTVNASRFAANEWNDSLSGDFLWNNTNFGEAVTEVMTPLTWSVIQFTLEDWVYLPGFLTVGNIGGYPYLNISVFATVFHTLGRSRKDLFEMMEGTLYMRLPDEMQIPLIPTPRWKVLSILRQIASIQIKQWMGIKRLPAYVETNQAWFERLKERITQEKTRAGLAALWEAEIESHIKGGVWTVLGIADSSASCAMKLRRELTSLVGPEDASALIGNVGMDADLLQSLGPLVGLAKVASDEITRQEYLESYGHRGPHEFELSVPRPLEDPAWFDRELGKLRREPLDIQGMLTRQREKFQVAWERLAGSHPRKVQHMHRRLAESARGVRLREEARSAYVRDRWLVRIFALRAGELIGLGSEVFFLRLDEVLQSLRGDDSALGAIPARQEMYRRLKTLPPLPSIIRGHFDVIQWAVDPQRRGDIFDAGSSFPRERTSVIRGSPGSAGRVEGLVRVIEHPEEGDQLLEGEILVAVQTDIAWTMLFPRATAVVTDVGAPLSHAAIVARELGIPAVVGCGDATARLKTGDHVRVDGGRGTVEILDRK